MNIYIYIYIYIQFWAWLLRFLFCYFQKLQLFVMTKFEIMFAALYFYFYELECVSQIIKILFQTGNINIFLPHGVLSSRYVQLKSFFSAEKKHQWCNLRHTFVEKPSTWQSIKGKLHQWQTLGLWKVVHNAKLHC